MKRVLISILVEEQRHVEEQILAEQRRLDPDRGRLAYLRQEASDIRRQLESIPDA